MNDPLDRLLRECCVQVKGAEQGTGFFVAPDLVLTCAHVVGRDRKPGDRRTRVTLANGAQKDDAKIRSIFPQEDLALLEVEPGPSHCVILGEQVCANERLLLMGFPVYDQAVGPECDGLNVWEDSETVDANGNTLVKFRGNLVAGGFSGGPALNLRTGEVIGVVRARRDSSGNPVPIGGWAVPSKSVTAKFTELAGLNGSLADQRELWRAALPERSHLLNDPTQVIEASPRRIDSLPYYATSFAGRELETSDCIEALKENRWVTLTGMGGIGKTRLAVEIARRMSEAFPDGVLLVELAATGNSEQAVLSTLAARLKEQGAEVEADDQQAVAKVLKNRRLLLVLDNFEHVMAGARLPAKLLRQCRYLRMLVTSQRPLGSSPEGEHERRIGPLEVPVTPTAFTRDQLGALASFTLFKERAKAVEPDWEVTDANATIVAEIIKLTEGIPLSLELAAARVGDASLEEIKDGISAARADFLSLEGTTLDERHTSIRACIDWTFTLLPPEAQVLLARLAVFAGGFFVADVEAVCQTENASNFSRSSSTIRWCRVKSGSAEAGSGCSVPYVIMPRRSWELIRNRLSGVTPSISWKSSNPPTNRSRARTTFRLLSVSMPIWRTFSRDYR